MPKEDYIKRETAQLMLKKWLDLVPAADVVEVVRCSVCKKVLLESGKDGKAAYWCPVYHCYRCYDEFCNRGERIEV